MLKEGNDMGDKTFMKELLKYSLCKTTKIDNSQLVDYQAKYGEQVQEKGESSYLCEIDESTNTRILFKIFKCVNAIKNIFIVGLICEIIGIILSLTWHFYAFMI